MPEYSPYPSKAPSPAQVFMALLLLWLAGNGLRLTILAVPPVIPQVHDDLNMNATQIGILTGLPSLLFAAAAVPGSLLIARLGVRTAMSVGLAIAALGGALRGAVPDVFWLYAMTIMTGAGVAVMQVTMPPAVRAWLPHRIGFATAVYSNGLIMGEILPVALMPPVLLLVGGSWQWAFVFWSVPLAIIAVMVLTLAPRQKAAQGAAAPQRRWWPDWHDPLIWRLGFLLGTVNANYFAGNAFLPDYLRENGQGEWISAALFGLNVGQLPSSMLLLAFAGRLQRKVWPFMMCGLLTLISATGMVFGSGPWIVAAASLLGFSCSSVLILVLALPPLLSHPDDVHRVTAAMFTISYTGAVIVPVLSGLAWDISGVPAMAFLPIALSAILLVILAPAINHIPRKTG